MVDAFVALVLFVGLCIFGFAIGGVLGWIAFFRTQRLNDRLEIAGRDLAGARADLARLTGQVRAIADQLPSAADWSADTPRPAAARPPADDTVTAGDAPEASEVSEGDRESDDLFEAPPYTPPVTAPPQRRRANLFAAIEASLAGNWLVWLAGVALAVGGGFIAVFAIEAGYFGPTAQMVLAGLLGAAMIAAGEWLRRNAPANPPRHRSMAPAVLAGAGVVTIYAAAYAAYAAYQLIPAPVAFTLLALAAAGAAALALLHGAPMVGLGLVGAYVAPFLIRTDEPNAAGLFVYVFFVTAVGLAVTRLVGRRWPSLVAIAGGAAWPLLWLMAAFSDAQAYALGLYLPAFAALAIAFAWSQSGDPVRWDDEPSAWRNTLQPSRLAAYLGAGAAALLGVLLAMAWDHDPPAIVSIAVTSALALVAAWRREGLTPILIIAGAACCATLYTWPDIKSVVIDAALDVRRFTGGPLGPEGPPFLTTCAAFAALFGLGGYLARQGARVEGPYAAVSAAAPLIILAIAYWRVIGVAHDVRWALGALGLTAVFAFAEERALREQGGAARRPGTIAAYALAATAAAAMVVGMALEQLWMSVGFAVLAPAAAWLWRRFDIPALKLSALIFGALATARLTLFGEVLDYDVGAIPIINWLLWGYGVSAIALWVGARWFEGGGLARSSWVVQSLEAGALILGVLLVTLQIRHAVNGGDLRADYDTLLEIGLQSTAWLAMALAIRMRLGGRLHFTPRWMERLLIFFGLAQVAIVHLVVMNPWWGANPAPVEGGAIFNALLPAFALPGVIAAAYAMIARRQNAPRVGTIAGLLGAALLWAWATLEVRRAFHHPWLSASTAHDLHPGGGPVTDLESYAYSALWVVYAALLMAAGFVRKRPSLRYASLGLLALTALKVVFVDTATLEGLLRGLSFIGVGAVAMAFAVLYQRVILPAQLRDQGGASAPRPAE